MLYNPVPSPPLKIETEFDKHKADYMKEVKGDIELTNLIKNGNFKDNHKEWSAYGATLSVSDNKAIIIGDGASATTQLFQSSNIPAVVGRKVYCKAKIKVANLVCSSIKVFLYNGVDAYTISEILAPTQDTIYTLSDIATIISPGTGIIYVYVVATYDSATTANGKAMEVQTVLAVDETMEFEPGNELEKIPMSALIDDYFGGWFDGTRKSGIKGQVDTHTKSKWYGKNLAVLGDSVTYGYGLTNRTEQCYTTLVKNKLGMANAYNHGVSSTRLAKVTVGDNSFTQRYTTMEDSADVVIVNNLGFNDYGSSLSLNGLAAAPFGTSSDRTDISFYGALHVLCRGLMTKYAGKTIILCTALHRIAVFYAVGDESVVNPETQKNLKQYVEAVREVAEYYGLPVLDFYKELNNINPNIEALRTAYVPDGIHPNAEGHQLIANAICNYLETH